MPLRGRLLIAPNVDYLERAFDATKYGEMSDRPWLEIVDSDDHRSVARAGRPARDVDLRALCTAATARDDWSDGRETLYASVLRVLEPHMPRGSSADRRARNPHAGGSGAATGACRADTSFTASRRSIRSWIARPLLGWAQYRTPVAGLYLASAGTHPGGGLTGLSGWLAAQTVERELADRRR